MKGFDNHVQQNKNVEAARNTYHGCITTRVAFFSSYQQRSSARMNRLRTSYGNINSTIIARIDYYCTSVRTIILARLLDVY